MTLSSRPKRRQEERTAAFVEQAAAVDTEQLHCLIPADLHRRLRVSGSGGEDHHNQPGGCRDRGTFCGTAVIRVHGY